MIRNDCVISKAIIFVLFLALISAATATTYETNVEGKRAASILELACTDTDTYDLLIISPSEFSAKLQLLIEHKSNYGISSLLKTTEDIYNEYEGRDNPERIKYCIKDAVERWNTTFVLLVGGADQVPGRYTHIYYDGYDEFATPSEWVFTSDFYYADIYDDTTAFSSWDSNGNNIFAEYDWNGNTDVIDLTPDVAVGRIVCIDDHDVETIVRKIIAYEEGEAFKQDWFTDVVLIGGDSLPGDDNAVDEGEFVNEKVIEILEGFSPVKIWASNRELYDAENINNAINEGAGFVFFNGHGNVNIWATHPHENNDVWIPQGSYTNAHISALENGDKLPIVISDACYHCRFDASSDCFGSVFLTNEDGGAIAFLGGSDMDMSYGGEAIITKGIEKLCLEIATHYMQGATTLGELIKKSQQSYLPDSPDEIDLIILTQNHLFGDPSLSIAELSQPPNKPSRPQGTANGKIRQEYNYTTASTDPDGDDIYYRFSWGDGTESDWIGPVSSGTTVETSHIWTTQGNYEIKVIAKDSNGVMSEWSDPLPISMPKTYDTILQCLVERIFELILNMILVG